MGVEQVDVELRACERPLMALLRLIFQRIETKENRLWFRGEASARPDWRLQPKVFRAHRWRHGGQFQFSRGDEVAMACRFRVEAPSRYSACPQAEDHVAWLCLMQHYGMPTRLLDWTQSPIVAAFFAVGYDLDRDEDSAVWILDHAALNDEFRSDERDQRGELATLAEQAFNANQAGGPPALAFEAAEIDLRLMLQRAAFTIHRGPEPLEERACADQFLQKIIIPQKLRWQVLTDLHNLDVRRSTLFPDLGNLAQQRHDYQADVRAKSLGLPSPPGHYWPPTGRG